MYPVESNASSYLQVWIVFVSIIKYNLDEDLSKI